MTAFEQQAWLGTLKVAAFWDRPRPDPRLTRLLHLVGLIDPCERVHGGRAFLKLAATDTAQRGQRARA
jgi:hypothetical protein